MAKKGKPQPATVLVYRAGGMKFRTLFINAEAAQHCAAVLLAKGINVTIKTGRAALTAATPHHTHH